MERNGNRVLVGIGAAVLAAAVLAAVATVAYHAGDDGRRERVAVREGEVVRVIDDHWGRGPGFGFLVFPLLITGAVLLLAGRGRRGPGPCGPGWGRPPWGPGSEASLDEWHRRVHGEDRGAAQPPAGGEEQRAASAPPG